MPVNARCRICETTFDADAKPPYVAYDVCSILLWVPFCSEDCRDILAARIATSCVVCLDELDDEPQEHMIFDGVVENLCSTACMVRLLDICTEARDKGVKRIDRRLSFGH
jgi:hypothetical protein